MKRSILALFLIVTFWNLRSQITISSLDMFYEPGQFYTARVTTNNVDLGAILGNPGGPQAWHFSNLPWDYIARFDYIDAKATPYAVLFPDAQLAERKTIHGSSKEMWLFLTQKIGTGRIIYGFYDTAPETFGTKEAIFDPPIIDFRESITYGDSWSAYTRFLTSIKIPDIPDLGFDLWDMFLNPSSIRLEPKQDEFGIPARITYTAQYTVDAYGYITLPDRSFAECLRVNELAQWDIEIDFDFSGNFQLVQTSFVRTYYWLAKNRGIVAQITSTESASPPPEKFSTAAAIMIQLETNHPESSDLPFPVTDLHITVGKNQILLTWTKPVNTRRFRIEWTENLSPDLQWKELQTTTNNFLTVPLDTKTKFFRVVSLP